LLPFLTLPRNATRNDIISKAVHGDATMELVEKLDGVSKRGKTAMLTWRNRPTWP
jgi:hypothetical protein